MVEAQAAVAVLAQSRSEAAAWWREHTPHLLTGQRHFIFPYEVGHVVES